MFEPTVYADGYGRWHAIVEDTPNGLTRAVNTIARELSKRGNGDTDYLEYVNQNICTHNIQDKPGFIHFVEYQLGEDVA